MKVRTFAAVLAAVAGVAGSAAASASAGNTYTAGGLGTKGGTPSKPKAATLNVTFSTGTTLGETFQPQPVVQFVISIEGGRLNKAALAGLTKCKPTPVDAEVPSADQCSAKSIVGKGVLGVDVGVPETVVNPSLKCSLPFNIYNVGPNGLLALFIDASPPVCPIPVQYWVLIKTVQRGRTVVATIDVPKPLQEVGPNTFASVVTAQITFRPIKVKVKGTSQSVTESIGCADAQRTLSVSFTDLSGGRGQASNNSACR